MVTFMKLAIRKRAGRAALLLPVLLIVGLALAACTFEVQPVEQYTSQDGYLSLAFPAEWEVLEDETADGTTLLLVGSDPEMMDMDSVPADAAAVFLMVMPNFIPEAGLEVLTLDAEELAAMSRSGIIEEPETEVGEIEAVVLPSDLSAYRFPVSDPEMTGAVYTFSPALDVLAMAVVAGATDGDGSSLVAAEQVLSSLEINGDPAEFVARAREAMGMQE